MEFGKTKKRNVGLKKEKTTLATIQHQLRIRQVETNENDGSDFRLLANRTTTSSEVDKKVRGRRLGIFGFGSKATKLPDAQG